MNNAFNFIYLTFILGLGLPLYANSPKTPFCQTISEVEITYKNFYFSAQAQELLAKAKATLSKEELEIISPLIMRYHNTPTLSVIEHFIEYMERFPLGSVNEYGVKSILEGLDPSTLVRNLVLPKNRLEAISEFSKHLTNQPNFLNHDLFTVNSPILRRFRQQHQSFHEEIMFARAKGSRDLSEMTAKVLKKRKIINACLSRHHNPDKAKAYRSVAWWITGIGLSSTLYSYWDANKDKPKDGEFYARIGVDLALQFALNFVYGSKSARIYSSSRSDWKKNWLVLRDITLQRNMINSTVYSTIFGVSIETAEQEITRLKLEGPEEWEKMNQEFSLSLEKIISDHQFQDELDTQAQTYNSVNEEYKKLEEVALENKIIYPGETLEIALADPNREEMILDLYITQNMDQDFFSSIHFDQGTLGDSLKRFSYDTAFAIGTTLTGEKMLTYMAMMTILCHSPISKLALPGALAVLGAERFVTDQLYYSGRRYFLGY